MTNTQREDIYWRVLVAIGSPSQDITLGAQGAHFMEVKEFLQKLGVYCQHNRDGISASAFERWWDKLRHEQECVT